MKSIKEEIISKINMDHLKPILKHIIRNNEIFEFIRDTLMERMIP